MSAIAGMTTAAPLCSQSSGMPVLNSLNGGVVSPLVMQQQPLPTSSPPAFIIQVSPSVSDKQPTNRPHQLMISEIFLQLEIFSWG